MPGTESESGGRLIQTPEVSNGGTWVGVNSTNAYDLTGKSVQIEVVQNPAATASQSLLREFSDGNYCVSIGWTVGFLYAEHEVGGVWTTLNSITWPMSPPVRAIKLTFETTGWMFYEYTQDGVNFVTLYSEPTPLPTTALTTMVAVGTVSADPAPGTAIWDNFNIPLTLLTLSGTSVGKATIGVTSITRRRPVAGSITGTATVSVAVSSRRALVGTSPGASVAAGSASARRSLVAAAAGSATTTGRFTLSGQSYGTSTTAATASRRRPVAGNITGTSTSSAVVTRRRSLVAASAGGSLTSGQTTDRRALFGTSAGRATADGRLILSGKAAGKATVSAQVSARRSVVGTSAGSTLVSAAVGRIRSLAAVSSAGTATTTGLVGLIRFLTVSAAGKATVSAQASRIRSVGGTANGKTLLIGIVGRRRTILGTTVIPGVAVTTGTTTARRGMSGAPQGAASVSGNITVLLGMQHVLWEYQGAQFVFPPSPGLHEVIWLPDENFVLDPNPSEITVPYKAEAEV